jgi:hypothetical protein
VSHHHDQELLRKIEVVRPFFQEFILKLFVTDHKLQLQYHPRLVGLQILYSAFYYPQDEVPDTGFWHTLH